MQGREGVGEEAVDFDQQEMRDEGLGVMVLASGSQHSQSVGDGICVCVAVFRGEAGSIDCDGLFK
jgi:hypothetical protein